MYSSQCADPITTQTQSRFMFFKMSFTKSMYVLNPQKSRSIILCNPCLDETQGNKGQNIFFFQKQQNNLILRDGREKTIRRYCHSNVCFRQVTKNNSGRWTRHGIHGNKAIRRFPSGWCCGDSG